MLPDYDSREEATRWRVNRGNTNGIEEFLGYHYIEKVDGLSQRLWLWKHIRDPNHGLVGQSSSQRRSIFKH